MMWLAVAICVFALICIGVRIIHDAPIGEEVDGVGLVTDPAALRHLPSADETLW